MYGIGDNCWVRACLSLVSRKISPAVGLGKLPDGDHLLSFRKEGGRTVSHTGTPDKDLETRLSEYVQLVLVVLVIIGRDGYDDNQASL